MKDWLLVFQSKKFIENYHWSVTHRIESNRIESNQLILTYLLHNFLPGSEFLSIHPFSNYSTKQNNTKDHRSDQHKRNVIQFHGLPLETLTTLLVIVFSSSINYFTKYCQSVFLISRETYLLKRTISDKPKNEKTFNDIFMTFYIRLPWFIKVITHMRS